MKRKVTFFYNDIPQKQLLISISKKLNKKKFDYSFTSNLDKSADIGIYAHDADKIHNVNSNLSIISLGGMDQGKLYWPNFWLKESWKKFDFGILPGKNWANMWRTSSWFTEARPKFAMLLTGWPKTQDIKIKNKKTNNTILYAPCFETDNKQLDVANAIKNTNYRLLIKHLPWNTAQEKIRYKDIIKNINLINFQTKKLLGNRVKFIDSKENIMKFFSKANLLITDESSVMYEALLFNLPTLVCEDWPMRTNNKNKPRAVKVDDQVCTRTKKNKLLKEINQCFKNIESLRKKTKLKKNKHFSFIKNSSSNINQFLISYIYNHKILFRIKPKYKIKNFKSICIKIKKKLKTYAI